MADKLLVTKSDVEETILGKQLNRNSLNNDAYNLYYLTIIIDIRVHVRGL